MIDQIKETLKRNFETFPNPNWVTNYNIIMIYYGILLGYNDVLDEYDFQEVCDFISENYPNWYKIFNEIDSNI